MTRSTKQPTELRPNRGTRDKPAKPLKRRRAKPRRGRQSDKDYLEWIASQPCIVTGRIGVTVHHVRRFGEPKSDRRTVPLIAALHMRTHEVPGRPCVERGKQIFESCWNVDLEAEIVRLNGLYAKV